MQGYKILWWAKYNNVRDHIFINQNKQEKENVI